MTIQELIDKLSKIDDKSKRVVIECIGDYKIYDTNEIIVAYIPKDNICNEYEKGILISNV